VETQYSESKKLTWLYSFDFVQCVLQEAKKEANTRKATNLKTFSFAAEGMFFFLFYSIYALLLMLPDTIKLAYPSKSSLINR